jgi:hypothetical protein
MEKPDAKNPNPTAPQNSTLPTANTEMKAEAPKATVTPVSVPTQPNKQVKVPEYAVCMASDPKVNEEAARAIFSKNEGKIQAVTPKKSDE